MFNSSKRSLGPPDVDDYRWADNEDQTNTSKSRLNIKKIKEE